MKTDTIKFKVRILKDNRWLMLGYNKTLELATKRAIAAIKAINGQEYSIVAVSDKIDK